VFSLGWFPCESGIEWDSGSEWPGYIISGELKTLKDDVNESKIVVSLEISTVGVTFYYGHIKNKRFCPYVGGI